MKKQSLRLIIYSPICRSKCPVSDLFSPYRSLGQIPNGTHLVVHFASKPFTGSESYEKTEIQAIYEEAVEQGKDASNVTIHDFDILKIIG